MATIRSAVNKHCLTITEDSVAREPQVGNPWLKGFKLGGEREKKKVKKKRVIFKVTKFRLGIWVILCHVLILNCYSKYFKYFSLFI